MFAIGCCAWKLTRSATCTTLSVTTSGRVSGKLYRCTNSALAQGKRGNVTTEDGAVSQLDKHAQLCAWHVRECSCKHHPMELSKVIEVPNDQGMCLRCYESTATSERKSLQKAPPRIPAAKIPGMRLSDEKAAVKRDLLLKHPDTSASSSHGADARTSKLTSSSTCCWQKEHFEVGFIWRCNNSVLMHPTMRGTYLPICGFHATRCVNDYGRKGNKKGASPCPPIDRRNPFGMCRNHLEAHLNDLNFEARGAVVLADAEFDVPGIVECKKEEVVEKVKRHMLAPTDPPVRPKQREVIGDENYVAVATIRPKSHPIQEKIDMAANLLAFWIKYAFELVLNHPNRVSVFLKEAIWRLQFVRRASVVATRIQRIYRGNRARRRARWLRYERAALRRLAACCVIQRFVRGFMGRRRYVRESERVAWAVPHLQRLVRGGLARRQCQRLRAAILLQRNYRWHRQRLLAWNFREEIVYMRGLQRQADDNLRTLQEQLEAFRRLRARRVLRANIARWKVDKASRKHEAEHRMQLLSGVVKVQRKWRCRRQYSKVKERYIGAQQIQKRVRGWLTRWMWSDDPNVLFITSFVNPRTGFEYGKAVLLARSFVSYAFPTRRIRMQFGAIAIQRVFRGHCGRLRANALWAEMLKRWEWIGIEATDSSGNSSDSMTVGKERYGFVLPSHGYHPDRSQHMRPVNRDPIPDRGHAYKYQYILDLIKDRDGKRAWSLERERGWKANHGKLRYGDRGAANSTVSPSRPNKRDQLVVDGTRFAMALYPVGSRVDVKQSGSPTGPTSRPKFRRARIAAIRYTPNTDHELVASFDVVYEKVRSCGCCC